jgi:hypothetical protein
VADCVQQFNFGGNEMIIESFEIVGEQNNLIKTLEKFCNKKAVYYFDDEMIAVVNYVQEERKQDEK